MLIGRKKKKKELMVVEFSIIFSLEKKSATTTSMTTSTAATATTIKRWSPLSLSRTLYYFQTTTFLKGLSTTGRPLATRGQGRARAFSWAFHVELSDAGVAGGCARPKKAPATAEAAATPLEIARASILAAKEEEEEVAAYMAREFQLCFFFRRGLLRQKKKKEKKVIFFIAGVCSFFLMTKNSTTINSSAPALSLSLSLVPLLSFSLFNISQ